MSGWLLALACVLAQEPIGAPAPAPRPPNVLFIVADDLLLNMLNYASKGERRMLTPNIDRLATEGVVLAGQHITSPVCTPSRYSCLTGRYASRATNDSFVDVTNRAGMSIVAWNTFIVPENVTLPKLLRQAGYRTGTVGKQHCYKWGVLERIKPDDDPRDPQVVAKLRSNRDVVRAVLERCGFDYAASIYRGNVNEKAVRGLDVHNLDWITHGALEFVDGNPPEQPFFLWFAPTVPHFPHDDAHAWNADPLATPEGYLEAPLHVLPTRTTLEARLRDAGRTVGNHTMLMLWLDDSIGALLDRLEERGIADDTVVFFFNDNGQDGKGSIYQSGACFPSVVWRKGGFPCGHRSEVPVTNLDFAPTILALAGAPIPAGQFDGESFLPMLEGKPQERREALYFEVGFTRGVLQEQWKYIALRYPASPEQYLDQRRPERGRGTSAPDPSAPRDLVPRPPFGHVGGDLAEEPCKRRYPGYWDADQLYDLASDPEEKLNLAARPEHAPRLAAMKALLAAWLRDLPGGFAELKPSK